MKRFYTYIFVILVITVLHGCSRIHYNESPKKEEIAIGSGPETIRPSCEVISPDFILAQDWVARQRIITIKELSSDNNTNNNKECLYEREQSGLKNNKGIIHITYYTNNTNSVDSAQSSSTQTQLQQTYNEIFASIQKGPEGKSSFDYEAINMGFAQESVRFPSLNLLLIRSNSNVFAIDLQGPREKKQELLAAQAIANNIILKIE